MTKRKSKKSENKLDKYLLLSWRKLWILVVGGFISMLLHNLIYAFFNFEEAFFFILVVIVLPLYFTIALIYSLIWFIRNKKKVDKDLFGSIAVGLIGALIINGIGYFGGPWFFGLFSLLISLIVYSIVKFVRKKF